MVRGVGFEPTQAYATGASVPRRAGRSRRFFPSHDPPALRGEAEKQRFIKWCTDRGTSLDTCQRYATYLQRPLAKRNKWSVIAYKLWAKMTGDKELYERLKTPQSSVDLKVPAPREVLEAVGKACRASQALCLVYKMLLESGARLTEVCKMLREFDSARLTEHNGFYTYALGYARGSKQSFYIFCITRPKKIEVSDKWVRNWASKNNVVSPKYIRKFVATAMASLGIPESTINFIQGRVPRDILSKHYLSLYALALQHYPRYAEWLRGLVLKN